MNADRQRTNEIPGTETGLLEFIDPPLDSLPVRELGFRGLPNRRVSSSIGRCSSILSIQGVLVRTAHVYRHFTYACTRNSRNSS